jgi:hypothetical protein
MIHFVDAVSAAETLAPSAASALAIPPHPSFRFGPLPSSCAACVKTEDGSVGVNSIFHTTLYPYDEVKHFGAFIVGGSEGAAANPAM